MKITPTNIKVKDLFEGYDDQGENGVFAYNGKLSIRPPYQREFVYNSKQAESVIQTVLKNFPLNVMYWVKTGHNKFEILDGQQRTLSIMQYLSHNFPITLNKQKYYWDSLPSNEYDVIQNYKLMVYICEGTESEKLDWFKIVNIAGERLTNQELRNSVYTGPWLFDAKLHFSKRNCAAKGLSNKYIKGDPVRQDLLEKALLGICENKGLKEITQYMSEHQFDSDADELWQYFQKVIHWIERVFSDYYSDMKGLDWCHLYNKYHDKTYNSSTLKNETNRLHEDDEVEKKKGIYEYLLSRDTDPYAGRLLNLRTFKTEDAQIAYKQQNGRCNNCHKPFNFNEMEADHIQPWSKGGRTVLKNCQMLCKTCNVKKSNIY